MKTTITLESMKFHAFHGVMAQERIIGGNYIADISYNIETGATETDKIDDTISYDEVYDVIKEEMKQPSNLIEHVAARALKALQKRFPQMQEITLKISKLNPPVNGEVGAATVCLTWKK